jgi:hypothetical protein
MSSVRAVAIGLRLFYALQVGDIDLSPFGGTMSSPAKRFHTCMATTETVKHYVEKLEEEGCEVSHRQPDCYQVVDDGTVVYQALQKGHGGPWIVLCRNSRRVTWEQLEDADNSGQTGKH